MVSKVESSQLRQYVDTWHRAGRTTACFSQTKRHGVTPRDAKVALRDGPPGGTEQPFGKPDHMQELRRIGTYGFGFLARCLSVLPKRRLHDTLLSSHPHVSGIGKWV